MALDLTTPPPTGATAPEHNRTAPSLYASDVEYVAAGSAATAATTSSTTPIAR
jgi:hypothetical protein